MVRDLRALAVRESAHSRAAMVAASGRGASPSLRPAPGFCGCGRRCQCGRLRPSLSGGACEQGDAQNGQQVPGGEPRHQRHLGNKRGVAQTVRFLGQLAVRGGDYATAERHLEECLGIERQLGSRRTVAEALAFLGHIADRQGDPLRSRRMLEESLLEFEQFGDQAEVRRVLSELERLRVPD